MTNDSIELEQKICDLIAAEDANMATVLSALEAAFTRQMARACPDCRKSIARTLKRGVPTMLKNADRIAVALEATPTHLH
jgi:hypothetical protein